MGAGNCSHRAIIYNALVILSEAKHLKANAETFRFAQGDNSFSKGKAYG